MPAALIATQQELLRTILPNPAERIVTTVVCRTCGTPLATVRTIDGVPACPVLVIGTAKSSDLIDYDRGRAEQLGTKRRRMTSATEWALALEHSTTPDTLPLWCSKDGARSVASASLDGSASTIRVG
jgi:hypothetical protein